MPDPENTQVATAVDKNGNDYGVTADFEREMGSWDQSQLEAFWRDIVNVLIAQDADVLPYASPSGDTAIETRVNKVIQDYLAELEVNPALQTTDAYNLNRADPTTSSTAPNVAQGADPVNLFDGDFVYAATDIRIDGAGIDFVFTRAYSQLGAYNGPLGFNWDHSYNLWLRVPGDGTIIQRSNGALGEETFRKHEQHAYWLPLPGGRGDIVEDGSSFIYRLPDGSRVVYQPHPTLQPSIHVVARIEDRFGNQLGFTYVDGLLRRVEVNHPERTLDLRYDTADRLTSIRDYIGRTWRYDYDDLGDLAAVTTPATPDHKSGLTTCYEYSTALNSDPNLQHHLTAIVDADGRRYLENEYGTAPGLVNYRRVTRQRQGSGEVAFEYADVIEGFDLPYADYERPTHQTIVTERDGGQSRYLFNRLGQMVFREEYARIDGVPRLVSSHYRYNRDGNLVGMISPLGVITQLLYGRDLYERQFPPDPDYRPEADANLTPEARRAFENLLTVVKRARYYTVSALNLARGVWSSSLFPDILQTNAEDVIQKFTYEPEFAQTLTLSDPRVTGSADPAFAEGPAYYRRLTRFTYAPGLGFHHQLLESVELPAPVLPDGTPSQPVKTRFPEYDGRGRRVRVVAPNGLQIVSAFAGAAEGPREGFLETMTFDPGGLAITTGAERDDLGRAVRVFRPPAFDLSDGRFFTTYEYNDLSQVVQSTSTAPFSIITRNRYTRAGNPSESATELKDETNTIAGSVVIVNRYDEEFNLTAQTVRDDAGQTVTRTRVLFDRAARPFLTIGPSGRKRKIFFTERSLVAGMIEDYGGVHAVTRGFYDADGRLTRVVDPRGANLRLGYDALGRLVDTEDEHGNRVIRHFDKVGNLLVECRYEKVGPDEFRLLARREFTYDELGRLIVAGANRFEQPPSVSAADLQQAFRAAGPGQLLTIQSFFDNVGNLVKQVDQAGRAFVSEYDLLGRATRKIDPIGNEIQLRYDKEGNVLRIDRREVTRDPVTNTVTATRHFAEAFAYDELGRLVEHATTTGHLRYRYDSRGNQVEVEDPLGNRSRNRYDVLGRLIENVQAFHQHQPGDVPVPVTTAFTYDLDDRKLSQTDALGRVTRFRYDSAGRLIGTVFPDGSADASSYDRAGNLIGHRDRNGLRLELDWDALGRPTALRVDPTALSPEANFAGPTSYRAAYDGLGRFTSVEDDFVVHHFTYNSLDHLLRESTAFTAATGLDPARIFAVGRAYANNGALIGLTYPSGREIQYARDALDRIVQVRQVSRGSDYPGEPSTPDQMTLAAFEYEGLQVKRVSRHNGVETTFAYDFAGRTVELRHANGSTPILTLQLLHDAPGNVRQRTEAAQDFQGTEAFRYDSLSRVFESRRSSTASPLDLSALAPSTVPLPDPLPNLQPQIDALLGPAVAPPAVVYDYDLVGNRRLRMLGGAAETYVTNQLDEYTHVDGASLLYDRNGNLVEDANFRYAFDYRNQLTRVVRKATGQSIDLFRDYFGRSCAQKDGSQLRVSVHAGHNLLEDHESGQLRRSLASDAEPDGILASASGGRDLYLLSDMAGSVRYVFDGAAKRHFYVYDEFGNLRSSPTSGDDNPFRFAGKQLLGDTDKYDFLFRVYDPARGRFIQRDPRGYVDGSNPYPYTKNNPLAFRDPDGLESRPEKTVSSVLYTARAAIGPVDRSGWPVMDPKRVGGERGLRRKYNLWSGMQKGQGLAKAAKAPGWIMKSTPQHATAERLESAWNAQHPGQKMPQDVFDDIWVGRSRQVARRAVLAGMPVESFGLDTHPRPTTSVQYLHELPTVRSWGAASGQLMKVGGLLSLWGAAHVDNPYVKSVGLMAGAAEVFGGTMYMGGAWSQSTWAMAVGSNFARFGGGVGLTFVSGYQFVQDVERGNVGDAIGSGSNAAAGITMIATSNPIALAATGTFAISYNGSRWIRGKTGWGDASGKAGASVANFIMGDDPGALRTGVGCTAGFVVTAGGVLIVEPVAFAGKKIGQGASWAYDGITDAIGYEFYWPF